MYIATEADLQAFFQRVISYRLTVCAHYIMHGYLTKRNNAILLQVLHHGGSALCRGLCFGLRCSHLSPAVSAVYRSLVASLPPDLWRQHFACIFLEALTSQHRC